MADNRQFAKIDVGYFDNPKIGLLVDDNLRAVAFHMRAILYCAQHRTDGVFPIKQVARLIGASYCDPQSEALCDPHSGQQCDWCECVHAGLFLPVDGRLGEVHDYLEHQQSSEQAQKRSDAGSAAAKRRWELQREAERNANRIADRSADGSADRYAEKRREEKRRKDSCASADADDASETGASAEQPATPDPTDTPTTPQPPKQKTPRKTNSNAALEGFDDWWAAYPRKTSKQAARRAYAAALKNGATPARLLEGLTAALPGLSEREARFVPYPATWLNGGAWEDEPDTPARAVPLAPSGPCSVDGAITDDAGTYTGWIHPTPVRRGGVVVHDPLGALGPPVVGGDHDWWAEQAPQSASESPAGSKRGGAAIRAVRAS